MHGLPSLRAFVKGNKGKKRIKVHKFQPRQDDSLPALGEVDGGTQQLALRHPRFQKKRRFQRGVQAVTPCVNRERMQSFLRES